MFIINYPKLQVLSSHISYLIKIYKVKKIFVNLWTLFLCIYDIFLILFLTLECKLKKNSLETGKAVRPTSIRWNLINYDHIRHALCTAVDLCQAGGQGQLLASTVQCREHETG